MVVTYNMTIQAVFFDLGGVILMEAARDFGIDARFSLMPGTVSRCLDVNSRWKEARVGLCSYEEWVDSVREALVEEAGGQADEVLQEALKAEAPVNEAVMRLVSALSVRYRIGAISNTKTRDLERFIKRRFGHCSRLSWARRTWASPSQTPTSTYTPHGGCRSVRRRVCSSTMLRRT